MMKDGWKTSEFWVMIAQLGAGLFGLPLDPVTQGVSALYVAARAGEKIARHRKGKK